MFLIWKNYPYVWTNLFTPVAVVHKSHEGHRIRLVEKVELVKTTEKSYGFNMLTKYAVSESEFWLTGCE